MTLMNYVHMYHKTLSSSSFPLACLLINVGDHNGMKPIDALRWWMLSQNMSDNTTESSKISFQETVCCGGVIVE